jgi:hypothetical protein
MDDKTKKTLCLALIIFVSLVVGILLGYFAVPLIFPMDKFVQLPYDVIKKLNPNDPMTLRKAALKYANKPSAAGDTINYTGSGMGRLDFPSFPILSGNFPSTHFEDIDNTRNVIYGRTNY